MFRFEYSNKSSKREESLQKRMHIYTVSKCDNYSNETRPKIKWRIIRWEIHIGFNRI